MSSHGHYVNQAGRGHIGFMLMPINGLIQT
jgi:hypothetical protein